MEDLLPYFERELVLLRRQGREFATRFPKLAGQLHLNGDNCADPHVERLIQSTALLAARISKRLDDDYPKLTETLFETLVPHYLRPFPSCSIAKFERHDHRRGMQAAGAPLASRGTRLLSPLIHGTPCTFKTAYAIENAALRIAGASFAPLMTPPAGVTTPRGASSAISMEFEHSATIGPGVAPRLRVFIDGELSFCSALRDALFMHVVAAYIETDDGRWIALADVPITPVGFSEEEALLPFSPRSHPAYRLLIEYFAFPEKFGFFDIDVAALTKKLSPGQKKITLHLAIAGLRHDSRSSRLLRSLSADNLRLHCTPIVNLFEQHGEPIAVTHTKYEYPVLAHPTIPRNFEIYSIDSVRYRVPRSGGVTEVRPFYSLHHGEAVDAQQRYWVARRDQSLAACSPGHETNITLVDGQSKMVSAQASLSLELSCTNRDLPASLKYGQPEGDLHIADDADGARISLLQRPTPSCRFGQEAGMHWRLIAHLALNHHALIQDGLPAFREMLTLHDVRQSPASVHQISGIVGLEHVPATMWMRHKRGASLVHGIEVRLTLDEDAYVGSGIHLFVQVINEFLALYVQANSFVTLVALSQQSGEELIRCGPRNGFLQPA